MKCTNCGSEHVIQVDYPKEQFCLSCKLQELQSANDTLQQQNVMLQEEVESLKTKVFAIDELRSLMAIDLGQLQSSLASVAADRDRAERLLKDVANVRLDKESNWDSEYRDGFNIAIELVSAIAASYKRGWGGDGGEGMNCPSCKGELIKLFTTWHEQHVLGCDKCQLMVVDWQQNENEILQTNLKMAEIVLDILRGSALTANVVDNSLDYRRAWKEVSAIISSYKPISKEQSKP